MDGLTEGRIVHYVMPDNEHRPAIVVRNWGVSGSCEGYINLQVFTDGRNDLTAPNVEFFGHGSEDNISNGMLWRTSICYDEAHSANSWHWIERA